MAFRRRAMGWFVAAALVALPSVGSAAVWVGRTKQFIMCPGLGHDHQYNDFTLQMEPGFGIGTLTIAGAPPREVNTNWTNDGRYAYFTVTGTELNGGPIFFYGWTRGSKMKGWFSIQSWGADGCMGWGVMKAWW
jgi:hypothetical protein